MSESRDRTSTAARRRRHDARRRRVRQRALAGLGLVAALAALAAVAFAMGRSTRHHRVRQTPRVAARHAVKRPVGARSAKPASVPPASAAIEKVLARAPYITSGGGKREVALTFDDGPGPYTAGIVRVLTREHVPATFFQIGRQIQYFRPVVRAELRDGFVIGDHTQDHPPLAALSPALQSAEIIEAVETMRRAGEPAPLLFRPPYRSFDSRTLAILQRLHMLAVLWSVDSEDYDLPGVPAIVQRVVSAVRPGGIVLMHDGGGTTRAETVAALPIIIHELRARHYTLVTIPQMLETNPPAPGGPHRPPPPGGAG